MKNGQIKIVVGCRLTLCTCIVKGKSAWLRLDKDLGDARHMGHNYSQQGNALLSACKKVDSKSFWKNATSFVEPLIIQ
jgi:hypothetical protein